MKTAEEILNKNYYQRNDPEVNFDRLVLLINEARKEAIEECAKVAKSEWVRWGEHMGHQVEKKSILSLINELK